MRDIATSIFAPSKGVQRASSGLKCFWSLAFKALILGGIGGAVGVVRAPSLSGSRMKS